MSNPHFLRSSSPTTAPYRSRTGRASGVRNVSPHEATYGAEISKIEADLRPCAEKVLTQTELVGRRMPPVCSGCLGENVLQFRMGVR